jgi:ribosomal protein S18 acetylase RimI-like enzyme
MPDLKTYDYRLGERLKGEDLLDLFAQAGWTVKRTPAALQTMLDHSPAAVSVWDGERLIGYARAVTDDIYRALIEDVIVDEPYRGQGVGITMLRLLLERLAHVEEIALVCEDKNIAFYERLGFERFDMTHMHIWKGSAE